MILSYANRMFRPGVGLSWSGTAVGLNEVGTGRAGALTELSSAPGAFLVDFAAHPVSIRVVALINVDLPVGFPVIISTRLAGMSGYGTDTAVTQVRELPTGERAIIRFWDGADDPLPSDGVRIELGDAHGAWTVGDIWVGPGLRAGIRSSFQLGIASDGAGAVSLGGQVFRGVVAPRRSARLDIVPQPKVRALESSNGLQTAQQALAVDPRCYVVPDSRSDQPWRTAMYGRVARIGPISGDKAGPYFEQRYDVEEIPGIVPGT